MSYITEKPDPFWYGPGTCRVNDCHRRELVAEIKELREMVKDLLAICHRAAPDHDVAISRAQALLAKEQ